MIFLVCLEFTLICKLPIFKSGKDSYLEFVFLRACIPHKFQKKKKDKQN
jgi:hypothetical protein